MAYFRARILQGSEGPFLGSYARVFGPRARISDCQYFWQTETRTPGQEWCPDIFLTRLFPVRSNRHLGKVLDFAPVGSGHS
jgi:hypothetical protein